MTPNPYGPQVRWIPEPEYQKLVSQYRLQLNGLFDGFCSPGRGTFTTGIVGMDVYPFLEEIQKLTEDFGLRVRGVEKVVSLELIRRRRINGA